MASVTRITLLLSAAFVFSLFFMPQSAFPSKDSELSPSAKADPFVRFVIAAAIGAGSMLENDNGDDFSSSKAFGLSAELSRAAAGITPFFQVSYYVQNRQWFHLIPFDLGCRFGWKMGRMLAYVSGGMSFFIIDKKVKRPGGKITGDWGFSPIIYLDLGARFMFKRHFGIEIRFDYRTYAVINVISLKIGFAF